MREGAVGITGAPKADEARESVDIKGAKVYARRSAGLTVETSKELRVLREEEDDNERGVDPVAVMSTKVGGVEAGKVDVALLVITQLFDDVRERLEAFTDEGLTLIGRPHVKHTLLGN